MAELQQLLLLFSVWRRGASLVYRNHRGRLGFDWFYFIHVPWHVISLVLLCLTRKTTIGGRRVGLDDADWLDGFMGRNACVVMCWSEESLGFRALPDSDNM